MHLNVEKSKCLSCGGCVSICPVDALTLRNMAIAIDKDKCTECATCIRFCPAGALRMETNL